MRAQTIIAPFPSASVLHDRNHKQKMKAMEAFEATRDNGELPTPSFPVLDHIRGHCHKGFHSERRTFLAEHQASRIARTQRPDVFATIHMYPTTPQCNAIAKSQRDEKECVKQLESNITIITLPSMYRLNPSPVNRKEKRLVKESKSQES
ncbi:hypothetical protein BV22DRAFT_706473 [Leucogyrophana mollusca]|uniref:Uncharacterized protein n=1 Tax=Leucogyrophana mollusca TaxID=85980 RepID=A0ACB8BAG5_9AGAM|nr:hypothetical protein BV22DRAFT_706473 [Leucogyrophana mollusca]